MLGSPRRNTGLERSVDQALGSQRGAEAGKEQGAGGLALGPATHLCRHVDSEH